MYLEIFPKYHMKILLEDFHAKLRKENIFKPTVGKESLHLVRIDSELHNKKSGY
jgi:hypothetical protein